MKIEERVGHDAPTGSLFLDPLWARQLLGLLSETNLVVASDRTLTPRMALIRRTDA